MKNRYIKKAHISERKFREILKYFTQDFAATQVARVTRISRVTINRLYHKFRERILKLTLEEEKTKLSGVIEIDEAYFGGKRLRWKKRGRGSLNKTPVVGLLKRGGKVYTKIIKNCTRKELMPIIQGKILKESTIYTNGWRSYDGLILRGFRHYRIHHERDEFKRGKRHINSIESFWSFTKRRLRKFNGIRKDQFILHLKESEFRWNHRGKKMYKILLKNFRENSL